MAKNGRFPGAYYTTSATIVGESEVSGSSGQVDMDTTACQDSSNLMRKCISLNSSKQDTFGVPTQVLSVSGISPAQRKGLVLRLRAELEQIQILQKKFESQRKNHARLSTSSDILSCSNVRNGALIESVGKSSMTSSGPGKVHGSESHTERGWNRSTSGRFESGNEATMPSSTCLTLLRQCEGLLKRLMSHQFGWVFNTPVDVVKLNLPDYFSVIKHPMDLGTIKSKLASAVYSSPLEFLTDVRLTFSNAMTYNPSGNDFHFMAKSMSKFFEARWKSVEKKIPVTNAQSVPQNAVPREENEEAAKRLPSSKRRKITSLQHPVISKPVVERIMANEEKHFLGRELESLIEEMPARIIDFLRDHSFNGKETGEDEIEIDIDDFSDDTLFTLRGLLDEYLQEKQKTLGNAHHCEIELLNESGPSNSSLQPFKENDIIDEDVDIGGNEPPVSSHPPVDIDEDSDSRSHNEADVVKTSIPVNVTKVPHHIQMKARPDIKISVGDQIETKELVSGLDQVEVQLQQMPNTMESDCCQDGDRAAWLKIRFADTILKAREKTLNQGENRDPEKLRREKEQLEIQVKKEKVRLQTEAKAAENTRRRAEAEAVVEAKRKRELEREAARQALLKIEKTVEINENSRFLKDLEMLRAAPGEPLRCSVNETSPDNLQDGFGGFKFGGCNPLEQLGLFMKDDEDEEGEQPNASNSLEQFGLYMKKDDDDEGGQYEQPSIPNTLEQFGLYMKEDHGDEEESELPIIHNSLEQFRLFLKDKDEVEEGEVPNLPNSLKQPSVRNTLEQLGLCLKRNDNDKKGKPSTVPVSPVLLKPSIKKDAKDETEPSNVPNFKTDDIEEGEID